jgi:hypothetical protein
VVVVVEVVGGAGVDIQATTPVVGNVVVGVGGKVEVVHPANISVMATVATSPSLRTVHSYSTSPGRRDVEVITRSGRWNRSRHHHGSVDVLTRPGGDRIGTTRGSQMPVNRVPSVFAGAVTGHAPAQTSAVLVDTWAVLQDAWIVHEKGGPLSASVLGIPQIVKPHYLELRVGIAGMESTTPEER